MFSKQKKFKLDKDITKIINSGDIDTAINMCIERYKLTKEEAQDKVKQYQISQETDYVYEKPKLRSKKIEGTNTLLSVIICTVVLILFLLIAYLIQLI